MSVKAAAVRSLFATLVPEDRCCLDCPGWAVFNADEGRPELQVCDACWSGRADAPTDDDVALLPEAQWALRGALAGCVVDEVKGVLWPGGDADHEHGAHEVGEVANILVRFGLGPAEAS